MSKWIPFTIAALVLSCIRVLIIITSSVTMLLNKGSDLASLGNGSYYANTTVHFAILISIALLLNVIKENPWRSIAFILHALMGITFLALSVLHPANIRVLSTLSAFNLLVMIFFTVQSFLISNKTFKSAFICYSIILILMLVINMGLPLLASYLALPLTHMRFTSIISIIPALIEVYILYLFNQYVSTPPLSNKDDFYNTL